MDLVINCTPRLEVKLGEETINDDDGRNFLFGQNF